MNVNFRNFAIWLIILFMLMGLFNVFQSSTRSIALTDKSYSQFISDVDAGSVTSVEITENVVRGTLRDGTRFETVVPQGADVVSRLEDRNVQITARQPEGNSIWAVLLSSWLPFIVIIGVWFFFIRQMQGGGRGGAMGFGKSRAKLLTEAQGKITFEDVAGVDEVLERAWASNGVFAGRLADQQQGHSTLLGGLGECLRHFEDLCHAAGTSVDLGGGDRLDGVDDNE